MDDENAKPAPPPRAPTVDDLLFLCRLLNEAGAEYVVIGGWAVIQHGYGRTTADIDLLVNPSPANFERIKSAMLHLPDAAIKEVQPCELDQYVVIRVCDEFVVDLMKAACGIEYAEASKSISWMTVGDVKIPFASPKLLWRTKQTYRDKDAADREFLRDQINRQERKS
ncbi:MAG: hypothetical protein ABSG78_17920 [Verrucomicrobiota bacterium]|jgi:hypothetical protein